MEKVQLEKIISQYKQFKSANKFSEKTISLLLKRIPTKLEVKDVVAIYDQSSFLKVKGMVLSVKGLHILGEKDILFEGLRKVMFNSERQRVYVYHNQYDCDFYDLDRKDRILVMDVLEDIMKTSSTRVDNKPQVVMNEAMVKLGHEMFARAEEYYGKKDYVNAFKCYEQAAGLNHYLGKVYLGYAYEKGEGVDVNKDKARDLYLEAAADSPKENRAYYRLGVIYSSHYKDHQKAIEYFKMGADLGHDACNNRLGLYYRDGEYITQDIHKAIECFERCGTKFGHYNLGMIYYNGEYVKKDYQKAYEHLVKSANMGHEYACETLYCILVDSQYSKRDLHEGLEWLNKGISLGSKVCEIYKGGLYASGSLGQELVDEGLDALFEFAKNGEEIAKRILVVYTEGMLHLNLERTAKVVEYAKELKYPASCIQTIQEKLNKLLINEQSLHQAQKQQITDSVSNKPDRDYILDHRDLMMDSEALLKKYGVQGIKDVIQYSIDCGYIPSQEYNDKLIELLGYIMDDIDEVDYVLDVQEELSDVYETIVRKQTQEAFDKALKEYESGLYKEALVHFKELYNLDRNDVAFYIGNIYLSWKNYEEALPWYKKCSPSQSAVQRAECYLALNDKRKAVHELESNLSYSKAAVEYLMKHLVKGTFTYTERMVPYIKDYLKLDTLDASTRTKLQAIVDSYYEDNGESILLAKARHLYNSERTLDKCINTYMECIEKYMSSKAMYELAKIYYEDLSDIQNYGKYIMMACNHDSAPACYDLAHYYERKHDMEMFKKYLTMAADRGDKVALMELMQFGAKMSNVRKPRLKRACTFSCSQCMDACPIDNIERLRDGKIYFDDGCIGCKTCVSVCDNNLIEF